MSELEDRINSILGDPEQMEKIAGLAKSLMGGEPTQEAPPEAPELDPGMLRRLTQLMRGGDAPGREQALLRAMEPYLSEKRRGKMDRALKLARMARLARLALGETGDGHDDPL